MIYRRNNRIWLQEETSKNIVMIAPITVIGTFLRFPRQTCRCHCPQKELNILNWKNNERVKNKMSGSFFYQRPDLESDLIL
jgi:hypothetical protein